MDIYEYIKKDHLKVSKLFSKALSARGSTSKRKFQEKIANELLLHAISEQNTFYKKLKQFSKSKAIATHGVVEHRDIKKGIKKMLAQSPDTDKWQDAVLELKNTVEHHVHDEETKMFKKAELVLDDRDTKDLVLKMKAFKKKILAEENNNLAQAMIRKKHPIRALREK